jgi:hypothetical protein
VLATRKVEPSRPKAPQTDELGSLRPEVLARLEALRRAKRDQQG